jgi:tetratricopeptide (TPR) repeat protein
MSKKPSHAKLGKANTPQSAQLDAVRKLSRTGRFEDAQARVKELQVRYPDFKPLLALAWEVQYDAGNVFAAAMAAWDWCQASPNSLAAHEALYDSALDAGMLALSASALQRLAVIGNAAPPDLPPIYGELAELSFEDAVAIDLSRLFLRHDRFAEASAILKDVDHPSARNNCALALFAQGHIGTALDNFEANWRGNTNNLFALNHVLRLRLWTGGHASASTLEFACADARPARAEDAWGLMQGLILLGAHAEAVKAWNAMCEAEFWRDEDVVMHRQCVHIASIAALRLGDLVLAAELATDAAAIDSEFDDALVIGLTHDGLPDCKIGEFLDWFPSMWVPEIRRAALQDDSDTALDFMYRRCDAHEDYLMRATELGGPGVRYFALSVLKLRAVEGNPTALKALMALLLRPCGPDEVRLELRSWLEEHGHLTAGESCKLLVRGEIRELQLRTVRLTAEPTASALPSADQAKLEKMHHLLANFDVDQALGIAHELVASHPRDPMLIGNLASIKETLGDDDAEIEGLYRLASEIAPDYLFGQTGLARIAARKGDIARAEELLKPLYGLGEYHFSEWRSILTVQRAIASTQGDIDKMIEIEEGLRSIEKQFR